jgi:hypothetical protein
MGYQTHLGEKEMTDSLPVLLHAAARGARIQSRDQNWVADREWIVWRMMPTDKLTESWNFREWRIHPKDHHLRYGPISSVLYEAAKNPPTHLFMLPEVADHFAYLMLDPDETFHSENLFARSLFLLIVAESLIEDGL